MDCLGAGAVRQRGGCLDQL
ncbi:MAG: hypothetical protein AMXMBFR13_17510, partial [Phycisphaerae bacterium]